MTKYAAWYELFPKGFINPAGSKAGAGKPGASPSKMKCFNCQKVGRRAADCTAAKKERNGGAEAGALSKAAGRKCSKCGQLGHMKVNCPGKAAAVDKTAKVESNGRGVSNKTVKFQVS